jgi:hypothetical protein
MTLPILGTAFLGPFYYKPIAPTAHSMLCNTIKKMWVHGSLPRGIAMLRLLLCSNLC